MQYNKIVRVNKNLATSISKNYFLLGSFKVKTVKMDLLGSILGKMDAPPAAQVDEETKKKVKGQNFDDLFTHFSLILTYLLRCSG